MYVQVPYFIETADIGDDVKREKTSIKTRQLRHIYL